jgi:hypothetical protein
MSSAFSDLCVPPCSISDTSDITASLRSSSGFSHQGQVQNDVASHLGQVHNAVVSHHGAVTNVVSSAGGHVHGIVDSHHGQFIARLVNKLFLDMNIQVFLYKLIC